MFDARWFGAVFLVAGAACSYDFASADPGVGGAGGGGATGVTSAALGTTTGAVVPTPLADCGGFEDDFDTGDGWQTTFAAFDGGRATMLGGLVDETLLDFFAGEILTDRTIALDDCFLSLRVEAAAPRGFTILAIEDGASRDDAFEMQIGPRIDALGVDVRGVQAVSWEDGDETVLARYVRIDRPTHLGIRVDVPAGRVRGFVRDPSGSWFLVGEAPLPVYAGSVRFNAAAFATASTAMEARATFDNLNLLPVTEEELAAAETLGP